MNWKQAFALGLCSVCAYPVQNEQWETVYEGTVETVAASDDPNVYQKHLSGIKLAAGEMYRITLNGEVWTGEAKLHSYAQEMRIFFVGNETMLKGVGTDTGESFLLWYSVYMNACLITATPGTYTVKIERKL